MKGIGETTKPLRLNSLFLLFTFNGEVKPYREIPIKNVEKSMCVRYNEVEKVVDNIRM